METKVTTKRAAKKAAKPTTLIDAIVKVIEKSEDSQLKNNLFKNAGNEIRLIAESYDITETQAVLFCVAIEKGPRRVDYNDLARHLDIHSIRILQYSNDINVLARRRLIRYRDAKEEEQFDINPLVLKELKHNRAYQLPSSSNLNCYELFEHLNTLFGDLYEESATAEETKGEIEQLFNENRHIDFVKQILGLKLSSDNMLILVLFCHLLVNKEDDNILIGQLEEMHNSKGDFNATRAQFRTGEHPLFTAKLIEHKCANGIVDNTHYQLTNYAKQTLLAEMKIMVNEEKISSLLSPGNLVEKKLFYPAGIGRKIEELTSFFQQENYMQIRDRLKKKGLRGGFACLFYGGPGTGKTETVYQLARSTGREIMVVDVPQLKSKWVGESEKNIKSLFDRYREFTRRREKAPILLFNEADAIIGIRMNGAQNAVDKMENSLQNIILQEMETLDGIMIATTNLQENMDKAFERRFLYKIKFEKPDSTVRSRIWQQMIPELNPADADTLAEAYDLSGGQIENVARKHSINDVLYGEQENPLQSLLEECAAEMLNNEQQRRKIGF